MTDRDLIFKKLSFIETRLSELRALAHPDQLETDIKERRFVEHTLQICIQAIQDVASHIVADERLGEPETNAELLRRLGERGWIRPELATSLRGLIGFRNILVHAYAEVDVRILRDVTENRLGDLRAFVDAIRARLT
jgi:uncharacterized protein YutE (UPF0331/DUF86 family)